MRQILAVLLSAGLLAACSDRSDAPTSASNASLTGGSDLGATALRDEAEFEFGIEEGKVGSNFEETHDRSFHAVDKIRTKTVTIARGGSVEFEIYPEHQPAIYEPGTRPEDIDTSQTEPIPLFPDLVRITDDDGRIALAPDQSLEEKEWTSPPGTFDEPGKYLVICTTLVHFVEANMYAWVIVK